MPARNDNALAHILVIDDDAVVRSLFRTALERGGYSVEVAEGGQAGLDAFATRPADLAIVDLVMPHPNGVATIRELRSRCPGVPVIPLTGILGSLLPADELAEVFGAAGVLIKPVGPEEILRAAHEALGQHRSR